MHPDHHNKIIIIIAVFVVVVFFVLGLTVVVWKGKRTTPAPQSTQTDQERIIEMTSASSEYNATDSAAVNLIEKTSASSDVEPAGNRQVIIEATSAQY